MLSPIQYIRTVAWNTIHFMLYLNVVATFASTTTAADADVAMITISQVDEISFVSTESLQIHCGEIFRHWNYRGNIDGVRHRFQSLQSASLPDFPRSY